MKTYLIALSIILLIPGFVVAAETGDRLAVVDFTAINTTQDVAVIFSDYLRSVFVKRQFVVIEKNNTDKVMEEMKFQQTGITSQDDAVNMGKMLNARKLVFGKVTRVGKKYVINADFVDVETNRIERSDVIKAPSVEEFGEAAEIIADKFSNTKYYYSKEELIFGSSFEVSPFAGIYYPLNYSLGTTHGGSLFYGAEIGYWKNQKGLFLQCGRYDSATSFTLIHALVKGLTIGQPLGQRVVMSPIFINAAYRTQYARFGFGVGSISVNVSEKYITNGVQETFNKLSAYSACQVFGGPVYKNFGLRLSYSFLVSADDTYYIRDFGGFAGAFTYNIPFGK